MVKVKEETQPSSSIERQREQLRHDGGGPAAEQFWRLSRQFSYSLVTAEGDKDRYERAALWKFSGDTGCFLETPSAETESLFGVAFDYELDWGYWERERLRQTDRHRDRQTETQTDRQTEAEQLIAQTGQLS